MLALSESPIAQSRSLSLFGCEVSSTGLVIEGELTQDRWEDIGRGLAKLGRSLMWVIGDWLLAGESAGYIPRGKLRDACSVFGVEYSTAANAVMVCKRFESSLRKEDLTFHHHLNAASEDNPTALLEWASENKATVQQLRAEKKRRAQTETVALCETSTTSILDQLIASGRKFGTIYADPPWKYGNQGTRAATDNHYSTMPIDDIASLPIGDLAAEQSHIHLWTTNGFLRDAFKLLDAWGFEFKSTFVWVKPQLGLGNYWRCSHELMLLGVRGGLTFPPSNVKSWIEEPRGKHSAKPHEIRKLIEQMSPGPRLELFSRTISDGWVSWGNEIERGMFDGDVQHN